MCPLFVGLWSFLSIFVIIGKHLHFFGSQFIVKNLKFGVFMGGGKPKKIQLLLHKSLTQCSLSLAQLFVYCMLYIRALSTITKATKMFSVHKSLFFQGKVLIRKISTLHDLTSKKKLTFSSTIFYVSPLKKQFSNIYPYLLEQNYKNL